MDNNNNNISDFSGVGLDKYMRPLDAPASNQGSYMGGMDFNTFIDRNAVTSINLKNFSFNAGTGGTLVLGGANNGNGNFVIKNAAGSTIVTGNNQGLTVTGGNISVSNANNTTILDTSGIVSTANFPTSNVEDNTVRTTTSTTPVDVSGGALAPFVLTRSAKATIYVSASGYNLDWLINGNDMQISCIDSVNGTLLSYPISIDFVLQSVKSPGPPYTNFDYGVQYQFKSAAIIADLTAGTHTMKLKFNANSGGTAELGITQLAYVLLGN